MSAVEEKLRKLRAKIERWLNGEFYVGGYLGAAFTPSQDLQYDSFALNNPANPRLVSKLNPIPFTCPTARWAGGRQSSTLPATKWGWGWRITFKGGGERPFIHHKLKVEGYGSIGHKEEQKARSLRAVI